MPSSEARDVIGRAMFRQLCREDLADGTITEAAYVPADFDGYVDGILTALADAGLSVEQGWRDIASAPKDHRARMLLWDPVEQMPVGAIRFNDHHGNELRLASRYDDRDTVSRCTHWAPLLPAPPARKE